MSYSKEFLDKTVEIWQPYSPGILTREDAREIAENMVNLVKLLNLLDEKYNRSGQS